MTDLRYGNLTKELQSKLDVQNIFTKYLSDFTFEEYPNYADSSEEVLKIMKVQESAERSGKWDAVKDFCLLWDEDIFNAFEVTFQKMGIPYDEEYLQFIYNTSEEIGALIVQLKSHYQRPRPYQLAFYTNQNLHPYDSVSAQSPSYPSGHAIQAMFLCNVIAFHYEEKKDELLKLTKQIADSRVILGLHYPTDNLFGFQIVKELMLKEDIKEKYFPIV
jgi:hypothetical protein